MATVGPEELAEVRKVFEETVNFGLGVHVERFEQEIRKLLGGGVEVVCVNTGTAALHLALEALAFPRGSEVIVPSITFVASYAAISAAGLTPVSCEVLHPSGHLDPADVETRITAKTVAVMPVAYTGCDFDRQKIYDLAGRRKLRVIEDDAHAFGSINRDGRPFGASGDVVCFSFDGIKNITCGEGGAIVTADTDLARKIRVRRSLGIEKDVELRYKGQRAWEYDVAVQGFRYHMSNINAAIGTAQLAKLPAFKARKQALVAAYTQEIERQGLKGRLVPTQTPLPTDCLHIFSCLLPVGTERNKVRAGLAAEGVESGFHYVPNHTHTLYRSSYDLPVAEDMGRRLISLPFHASVEVEQVRGVVAAVKKQLG
jgi:dTDP-4-amino-4,6-dideoxygalactose transaminase